MKTIRVVLHRLDHSGACRVLLRAAGTLARSGYDVSVVVPRGARSTTFPVDPGVTIREVGIPLPIPGQLGTLLRTMSLLLFLPRSDYTLFGYYLCGLPIAARCLAGGWRNVIFYVPANEPAVAGAARDGFGWLRSALARIVWLLPFTRACTSRYVADALRSWGHHATPIIHPGVDHAVFGAVSSPAEHRMRIALIGNRRRTKGWEYAAQTVRRLAAMSPDLDFLVLGERPDGTLDPLGDRVTWARPETDAEVAAALRSATLFYSSSWSEGFGLFVLESMAAGTPVVAVDSGGVRDFLLNGENGVLIPRADLAAAVDAIDALLGDETRRRSLRDAGRRTALRFDWPRFERQMAGFVASLDRAVAVRPAGLGGTGPGRRSGPSSSDTPAPA